MSENVLKKPDSPAVNFSRKPLHYLKHGEEEIPCFLEDTEENLDPATVTSFGDEWEKFASFSEEEIQAIGDEYFDIVDKESLQNAIVLDVGCGSGRWSRYLADYVGCIEAIDPSEAVLSASAMLTDKKNVRVSRASVDTIPFADESFDFIFSLGVLHHVPDTLGAIQRVTKKLKTNGLLLLYLYYNLDNRGWLYKTLFHLSNTMRWGICRLPKPLKLLVCDFLALLVYLPLVSLARLTRKVFPNKNWHEKLPLSCYIDRSFHVMRNDSLDRFGTPLEQRFSRAAIEQMLKTSGYTAITFSERAPYWHVVARKNG